MIVHVMQKLTGNRRPDRQREQSATETAMPAATEKGAAIEAESKAEVKATAEDDSINEADLCMKYASVHAAHLKKIRKALTNKPLTFYGDLYLNKKRTKAVTIHCQGLTNSAVNKILKKMAKQGRLHDDIRIVLNVTVAVPTQRNDTLPGTMKCTSYVSDFIVGWGIIGTHNFHVEVGIDELVNPKHGAIFSDFRLPVPQKRQQKVNSDCCICLETMDTNGSIQCLSCGHTVHRRCYRRLKKQSRDPCCPLCRASL